MAFSILKGACGSCAAQLPFSSVRSQKAILKKKAVTSKTQNVFSSTPSWQNGSAWARACVTHNANPKWISPPYIVCMYVVKAWVTQIKHLIFTFRHEINQVHWLFLKNKIFTPQAPLHSLVMRDIDRYRHLISAGPTRVYIYLSNMFLLCISYLGRWSFRHFDP